MSRVTTINLKGKEYATVPERLKEFREQNPRATIETTPIIEGDVVIFKAKIVKDKNDPSSAEATGHSYGKLTGEKAFEKLETVATGRALSLLGYLNDGQIASTEEMKEFEGYQAEKIQTIIVNIGKAKQREDFKAIMSGLTPDQKREVTPIINKRIEELKNADSNSGTKN